MRFFSERVMTVLGVLGLVLGTLAGSDQLPQAVGDVCSVLAGIVAVLLGKTHPGMPGIKPVVGK